jgi:hypothetical protein
MSSSAQDWPTAPPTWPPPQPESLDTLRRQSKIRIQFWRELRRDLESLGE